jgi:hypothetical protein
VKILPEEDFGGRIPFSYRGDDQVIKRGYKHRMRVVTKFMGEDYKNLPNLESLDIGRSNRFGRGLGIKHNTLNTDFNREICAPGGPYDIITFFETLEHLLNPLGAMDFVYANLKPGGRCYLSCPSLGWLGFFQGPNHFCETKRSQLERLFRYVGLDVVKYDKIQLWDRNFIFFGFRPLWRVLFNRTHLFELRKP